MKTAFYGLVCLCAGGLIEEFTALSHRPYGLLIGIAVAIPVACLGLIVEALTVNQFIWGNDRHDQYEQ